MSDYKYQELENHLRDIAKDKLSISLSFKQIEDILGFDLPKSARTHRAWWGNEIDTSSRSQARAWRNAGFVVESLQQNRAGSVQFKRVRLP